MNMKKFNQKLIGVAVSLVLSTSVAHADNITTPNHLANDTKGEFSTQPFENGDLNAGSYTMQRISFNSHGSSIVGNLLLPKASPKATVVVMGPVAFVKEQSPIQYASRLVKYGYAVLIFDPRYHGESAGEPRRFESRIAKVEDIQAAVDFIKDYKNIKNLPIYGLGICQGVNWVIEAANLDKRISKISVVAGHYLTPEIAALYTGSSENADKKVAQAKLAKTEFEKTGAVSYIPIVSTNDPKALLGAPPIYQFYNRWSDRGSFWNFHGLWENRITQMSEADIWGHDIRPIADKLATPVLMIHADHAASGEKVPHTIFKMIPAKHKQLEWLGKRNQMQFYEDPITIDLSVEKINDFFQSQLN